MLIAAVSILAVSLLVPPIDSLVLVTGERIEVSNEPEIAGSTVIFRAANDGSLYSIPLDEIDLNATNRANRQHSDNDDEQRPAQKSPSSALDELKRADAARSISSRSIVVSEDERTRLIRELSKSRGDPSSARSAWDGPASTATSAGESASASTNSEEWAWRDRARGYQERVRQCQEELQFLIDRERNLQDEILGLMSLGYKGDQFAHQVLSLAATRDQIPRAKLELERAERALAQFMDDARRQGILPGWLR